MMLIGMTILACAPLAFSQSCGNTVDLSSSNPTYTFTTPNYPGKYFSARCTWNINAPNAQTMTLLCEREDRRRFCFRYSTTPGVSQRYCRRYSFERTDSTTFIGVTIPAGRSRRSFGFKCTVSYTPISDEPTTTTESPPSSTTTEFPPSSTTTEFPPSSTTTEFPPSSTTTEFPPSSTTTEVSPSCNCGIANRAHSRIVNGENAEMHEFPWMAALRQASSDFQFCGGSLIEAGWVLTAAHCVDDRQPSEVKISLGDHDKSTDDETDKTVHVIALEIIVHENWNPADISNDIALIRIPTVDITREISPICLPINSKSISGKTGTVIGWGLTIQNGVDADILQKVEMNLLTAAECRSVWNSVYIKDTNVCAYKEEDLAGSCQGDSGGPLFLTEGDYSFQVGIVSFGVGCASEGYPGVYARVESYIDWIQEKTGESFCVK